MAIGYRQVAVILGLPGDFVADLGYTPPLSLEARNHSISWRSRSAPPLPERQLFAVDPDSVSMAARKAMSHVQRGWPASRTTDRILSDAGTLQRPHHAQLLRRRSDIRVKRRGLARTCEPRRRTHRVFGTSGCADVQLARSLVPCRARLASIRDDRRKPRFGRAVDSRGRSSFMSSFGYSVDSTARPKMTRLRA